eukprot:756099-Hanusia_phi.AAC.3
MRGGKQRGGSIEGGEKGRGGFWASADLCDSELLPQLLDLMVKLLLSECEVSNRRLRRGGGGSRPIPFFHFFLLLTNLLCSVLDMVLTLKSRQDLSSSRNRKPGRCARGNREGAGATCFIRLICRWYSLEAACMREIVRASHRLFLLSPSCSAFPTPAVSRGVSQ